MEVSTQLSAVFSEVPDPRRNTLLKQHLLSEILLLSLFATLSGCDTDEEIEEYGKNKEAFLREFLFLPISIDAAVNGPAVAEQIVEQQGHYLLSLKKNQKNTFEQADAARCRTT